MKNDIIRRSGLASAVAIFLLLGAVLPNVFYLGHAQPALSHDHAVHQSSTPPDAAGEEHALHCHAGPSGCAGGQSMVGSIWVGDDAGFVAPSGVMRTALNSSQPTTPEAPVISLLKPPRAA